MRYVGASPPPPKKKTLPGNDLRNNSVSDSDRATGGRVKMEPFVALAFVVLYSHVCAISIQSL